MTTAACPVVAVAAAVAVVVVKSKVKKVHLLSYSALLCPVSKAELDGGRRRGGHPRKTWRQTFQEDLQETRESWSHRYVLFTRYRTAYSSRIFIMSPPLTYLLKWRQVL